MQLYIILPSNTEAVDRWSHGSYLFIRSRQQITWQPDSHINTAGPESDCDHDRCYIYKLIIYSTMLKLILIV